MERPWDKREGGRTARAGDTGKEKVQDKETGRGPGRREPGRGWAASTRSLCAFEDPPVL